MSVETRASKAAADARWEAEAEYRERHAEEKAEHLLTRLACDNCHCDRMRQIDPHCVAAGECAIGDE